jgi:hypothetical protein
MQEPPPPPSGASQDEPKERRGRNRGGRRMGGLQQQPAGPQEAIELPTGPMRIELFSVAEERIRFQADPPENAPKPKLRLRVTMTGERLPDMVGIGHLVIEEMIDDTGAVLASPADIEPRDREATTPVRISPRILARGSVDRIAEAKAPDRSAKKLTKVSGWVNAVYGKETEDLLIDNPLQYKGGYIKHPRLEELGMKIRVVEPGSEINEKRDGSGIALQYENCSKQIRRSSFFDAWMKPLYPRARRMETADGQEYVYYGVVVGEMDADSQMTLTIYPKIDEERVLFEFKDVELP